MSALPLPDRRDTPELLDRPSTLGSDLAVNLADIRRLNRWFGGRRMAKAYAIDILRGLGGGTLLDVATGSADIPAAIARAAGTRGMRVQAIGLDVSPDVLAIAGDRAESAGVELVLGDARELPFPDRSFDLVMSCLALHHFSEPDAVVVLREMWRVTRHAILIVDLYRSYPAYWGTWLATRCVARSKVTRHDGPVSVLRAFSPAELAGLAAQAGVKGATIRTHLPFRQVLVAVKPGADD